MKDGAMKILHWVGLRSLSTDGPWRTGFVSNGRHALWKNHVAGTERQIRADRNDGIINMESMSRIFGFFWGGPTVQIHLYWGSGQLFFYINNGHDYQCECLFVFVQCRCWWNIFIMNDKTLDTQTRKMFFSIHSTASACPHTLGFFMEINKISEFINQASCTFPFLFEGNIKHLFCHRGKAAATLWTELY